MYAETCFIVLSDIVVANSALPGAIVSTPCGDDEIFNNALFGPYTFIYAYLPRPIGKYAYFVLVQLPPISINIPQIIRKLCIHTFACCTTSSYAAYAAF